MIFDMQADSMLRYKGINPIHLTPHLTNRSARRLRYPVTFFINRVVIPKDNGIRVRLYFLPPNTNIIEVLKQITCWKHTCWIIALLISLAYLDLDPSKRLHSIYNGLHDLESDDIDLV